MAESCGYGQRPLQRYHALESAPEGKAGGQHLSWCTLTMLNIAPEAVLFSLCNQYVGDLKAGDLALKQLDVNWALQFNTGGTPWTFLTCRGR